MSILQYQILLYCYCYYSNSNIVVLLCCYIAKLLLSHLRCSCIATLLHCAIAIAVLQVTALVAATRVAVKTKWMVSPNEPHMVIMTTIKNGDNGTEEEKDANGALSCPMPQENEGWSSWNTVKKCACELPMVVNPCHVFLLRLFVRLWHSSFVQFHVANGSWNQRETLMHMCWVICRVLWIRLQAHAAFAQVLFCDKWVSTWLVSKIVKLSSDKWERAACGGWRPAAAKVAKVSRFARKLKNLGKRVYEGAFSANRLAIIFY